MGPAVGTKGRGRANCCVVPLAGAAPLCALVATAPVARGEALVRGDADDAPAQAAATARLHAADIIELRKYLDMAYDEGQ